MIASGLGLSKFFGVSNSVVAIWLGASLLALAQINIKLLVKVGVKNIYSTVVSNIATYCLVIPLYIGANPILRFNEKTILGIDEFLFSTVFGILTLALSLKIYYRMKEKNGGPHFPFEKIVLPMGSLVICSVLMNYLGS
jgi:hypothetical protein